MLFPNKETKGSLWQDMFVVGNNYYCALDNLITQYTGREECDSDDFFVFTHQMY